MIAIAGQSLIMTVDPRSASRRKVLAASSSLAVLGLAGCLGDENGEESEDDGAAESLAISEYQLLDRDDDEAVLAYVHDDHWDDGPLEVPVGDNVSLGAYIEDEDGTEIEVDGPYTIDAEIAEGAIENVEIESHGDHIHITGEEEGPTELVFHLLEDDEVVFESPELTTQVGESEDDDFDASAVNRLTILDRSPDPHEEVAEYHDDHWEDDVDIPTIPVDDNISLGGMFEDDAGNEIPIDGTSDYELAVEPASEDDEDIISIDPDEDWHGDHVHIYGDEEGEAEVIFSLWHDDHADWETEPVTVEVSDD